MCFLALNRSCILLQKLSLLLLLLLCIVHTTEGVINEGVVQALLPDDFNFDMQQDVNIHSKNNIPSMHFVYVYAFVLCFVMYVIPEK